MKKGPKKHLSARQQCLRILPFLTILIPLGVICFLLHFCYPFTPRMAIYEYELDNLYGPSEQVTELPANAEGRRVFLCAWGNRRSLCTVTQSLQWYVEAASPVLEVPAAEPVNFYSEVLRTGRVFGLVRDKEVTRVVVTGSVCTTQEDALLHDEGLFTRPDAQPLTLEITTLYDGAFVADTGAFWVDEPVTVDGYNTQGELLFSRSFSLTPPPMF